MSAHPIADLSDIRSACYHLAIAETALRRAKVRRAAVMCAQALKSAQGAERALLDKLNHNGKE